MPIDNTPIDNPDNFESQPSGKSDPLDDLLAEARWPEPTPLVNARLQRRWRELRPRESRFDRRWLIAAAAAVLIGVAWFTQTHWNAADRARVPIAEPDPPSRSVPLPSPNTIPLPLPKNMESPQELSSQFSTGRPPNPLEMAVLNRAKHQPTEAKNRTEKKPSRNRPTDPLVVAVNQLEHHPGAVIAEKPGTSLQDRRGLERRLLTLIPRSSFHRQRTLLRLLNSVASSRSIPLLVACRSQADLQPLAEPVLLRVADAKTLYRLSQAEFVAARQAKFLEKLFTHTDPHAVDFFLQAVLSPQTRRAALDVAKTTPNPPTAALLDALNHRHADVRTMAALVVGRVLDDTVTPRLVQWVHHEPSRQELWIALLERPEPNIRSFVAQACRSQQVYAAVSSAEQMRQTFNRPATRPVSISTHQFCPVCPS